MLYNIRRIHHIVYIEPWRSKIVYPRTQGAGLLEYLFSHGKTLGIHSGTVTLKVVVFSLEGVTKSITMDVTLMGPEPHPRTKKPAIGIKAICKINRKDFGVGADLAELMVGNEVELRATGEFNKD